MNPGLEGRVVVVTAAGSGIGLATAQAFAAQGAQVVAADIDVSAVDAGSLTPYAVDLLDLSAGSSLTAFALDLFGRVDVLVNALGGLRPRPDGFSTLSDDDWLRTFELNFFGTVRVTRAVVPHMVAAGSGSIVSIASEQGRQPDPWCVDYAAAKAAIISLSKSLSIELAPHGVRSNVVAPGPTRTPSLLRDFEAAAAQHGGTADDAIHHFVSEIRRMPMARLGEVEQVANVILFLASDLAGQVTGSEYRVDGGVNVAA